MPTCPDPEAPRTLTEIIIQTVSLTQAVAALYMTQRGSGSIVHVTARPAIEPTRAATAYNADKAALFQPGLRPRNGTATSMDPD